MIIENGGAGEASYLRTLAIDEALSRTEGDATLAYLADVLGSTVALADAAGASVTTYTYAPFGETSIAGSPSASPFQFTGREQDLPGLYYYRARYYDSIRSRFVSEDPIGAAGGDTNLFAYVLSRPLNSVDPWGLWLASGHTGLTNSAMSAFNAFSQGDISRVVQANVAVDSYANFFTHEKHYEPGSRDKAEWLIRANLESAIILESAGLHDYAMEALGRGLHTLQDKYSHFEQQAGLYRHLTNSGCDDPTKHPREFFQAQDASRRYVDQFLLGIGMGR